MGWYACISIAFGLSKNNRSVYCSICLECVLKLHGKYKKILDDLSKEKKKSQSHDFLRRLNDHQLVLYFIDQYEIEKKNLFFCSVTSQATIFDTNEHVKKKLNYFAQREDNK